MALFDQEFGVSLLSTNTPLLVGCFPAEPIMNHTAGQQGTREL